MNRREFIKSAIAAGVAAAMPRLAFGAPAKPIRWSGYDLYQDAACTIPLTDSGPVGGMIHVEGGHGLYIHGANRPFFANEGPGYIVGDHWFTKYRILS